MLALSSLDVKDVKLSCEDFLVGCVAENDPQSLRQALRLLQSLRWLGGEMADAQVRVCVVGRLGPSFRQAFERYGAEVRTVPRDLVTGTGQIPPEIWETDRE